jgi:hypothetical protein
LNIVCSLVRQSTAVGSALRAGKTLLVVAALALNGVRVMATGAQESQQQTPTAPESAPPGQPTAGRSVVALASGPGRRVEPEAGNGIRRAWRGGAYGVRGPGGSVR